mmetsp:Transcript_22983/g.48878  ORF Transcript_22983/g.48878 Transcript_22983/m.48878 type:complete len:233 (-) Transcript_22983:1269-1967(-)
MCVVDGGRLQNCSPVKVAARQRLKWPYCEAPVRVVEAEDVVCLIPSAARALRWNVAAVHLHHAAEVIDRPPHRGDIGTHPVGQASRGLVPLDPLVRGPPLVVLEPHQVREQGGRAGEVLELRSAIKRSLLTQGVLEHDHAPQVQDDARDVSRHGALVPECADRVFPLLIERHDVRVGRASYGRRRLSTSVHTGYCLRHCGSIAPRANRSDSGQRQQPRQDRRGGTRRRSGHA